MPFAWARFNHTWPWRDGSVRPVTPPSWDHVPYLAVRLLGCASTWLCVFTMLKVLCGVMQFRFDIDGQRATLAYF